MIKPIDVAEAILFALAAPYNVNVSTLFKHFKF